MKNIFLAPIILLFVSGCSFTNNNLSDNEESDFITSNTEKTFEENYQKIKETNGSGDIDIENKTGDSLENTNNGVNTTNIDDIVVVGQKTSNGFIIQGDIPSDLDSELIKFVGIKSCKNSFNQAYDNVYILTRYVFPKFNYIINKKHNNICDIPYQIIFYDKDKEVIYTISYTIPENNIDELRLMINKTNTGNNQGDTQNGTISYGDHFTKYTKNTLSGNNIDISLIYGKLENKIIFIDYNKFFVDNSSSWNNIVQKIKKNELQINESTLDSLYTILNQNTLYFNIVQNKANHYTLIGSAKDKLLPFDRIEILSCNGNNSDKYSDKWYRLSSYSLGNKKFVYNISDKFNNLCQIPYKIKLVYNDKEMIIETMIYK